MAYGCFKQDCELEVQYVCHCLLSVTYCCDLHLKAHLKLPNRVHSFDSILAEPSEQTKDAILNFLVKEKSKKEKLKEIIKAFYNQNLKNDKNSIISSLNDLNSDLQEINYLIEKISQASEEAPLLNSLKSQHDNYTKEAFLPNNSELYARVALLSKSSQIRNKKSEILNRANNDPETEQDFRNTCLLFENSSSNVLIGQAYQEYINEYQNFTSTCLIDKKGMYIYNTETEKEEIKVLEAPEEFKYYEPLTQLPNGELFFIGRNDSSCIIPCILDRNYQIKKLPLGAPKMCFGAVYFNKNIFCFGANFTTSLYSSRKFDLDQNRWTEITPMKKYMCGLFTGVVFNRNILISLCRVRDILLYSIDTDSFSEIPFENNEKILINAGDRLYLIECKGWIYESEVGDEYVWKKIAKSIIQIYPIQICCSYNKGGIYISIFHYKFRNYFKFDLNKKALIEIAFLSENIDLQRSGDKFEIINYYDKACKLNLNYTSTYINNEKTLCFIGKNLKKFNNKIERYEIGAKDYEYAAVLAKKGDALCDLGIYLAAIENYNAALECDPNYLDAYIKKGNAFTELGRYIEAIDCYNEVIKHKSNYTPANNNKGNTFQGLGENIETIEYSNESTKTIPFFANAWNNKAEIFMSYKKNIEKEIKCFRESATLELNYAIAYNNKGKALSSLDRNSEAIECYTEAIKIKPDGHMFYINRGKAFNKLGRPIEAIQDLNKADELMKSIKNK